MTESKYNNTNHLEEENLVEDESNIFNKDQSTNQLCNYFFK